MKAERIPEKSTGIHEGHRKRVQDRFLKSGIDGPASHEVLEMLLFFLIRRGDTNKLAHRLINRLGFLSGILYTPYEELLRIRGVGRASAFLMKLTPELCCAYYEDCHKEKIRVFGVEQAAEILHRKYISRHSEVVVLLLLDSQCRLLLCEVVSKDTVSTVPVHTRHMVELVARYNANTAIMSHSHPGGSPVPSRGDIESTTSVYHVLQAVSTSLRSHIIFDDEDYMPLSHPDTSKDIVEPSQPVVGSLPE